MIPAAQRLALLLAVALFSAPSARAVIIYGTGPNDLNSTLNTTAPGNGAPWYNVVQFGAGNASGVYLGHGCVLTANHVNDENSVVINGVSYNRDLTFAPLHVTEDNPATAYADVVDLKLIKIRGNEVQGNPVPVLPPLPVVQHLPLNYSTTGDLSTAGTMTGWGEGKGSFITALDGVTNANKGWLWGGGGTRAQRWAANTTLANPDIAIYTVNANYHYEALETAFNRALGGNTGQITFGDSGGGYFQQFGVDGVWKLSGINTSTLAYQASAATYDGNAPYFSNPPNGPPALADSPDSSEYVRISRYGHLLRYENWAGTKLGDPAASLTADPDKDGGGNLLEYAFHTDPNAAASSALPQAGSESGYLTLTYTQLLSATDLTYVVEETPGLSPAAWVPATVVEEIVSTSGVTRVVKAKVAIGLAPQKFLRLSVTRLQ